MTPSVPVRWIWYVLLIIVATIQAWMVSYVIRPPRVSWLTGPVVLLTPIVRAGGSAQYRIAYCVQDASEQLVSRVLIAEKSALMAAQPDERLSRVYVQQELRYGTGCREIVGSTDLPATLLPGRYKVRITRVWHPWKTPMQRSSLVIETPWFDVVAP